MESSSIKVERRGRKRKKTESNENVSSSRGRPKLKENDNVPSRRGRGRPKLKDSEKLRVVPTSATKLVGRYIIKEFEGNGVFLGKIMSYDGGLYKVEYEDGDCEDLEGGELRKYLVDDDHWDEGLLATKNGLNELLKEKECGIEKNGEVVVDVAQTSETICGSDVSGNDVVCDIDGDVDSSSDSCQMEGKEVVLADEIVLDPPPELPPSSGTIGVPEEYVSYLFSTYGFLQSFSIRLFLSPFKLDDFVGSLNCAVPNTLLDAVHVALLRPLGRHLETLSSEGSQRAAKCLRYIDWSLLDGFTWPVYLVHYLIVMGYFKDLELKGCTWNAMIKDYYSLSAGIKLMMLQILCDDVLDSAELREEIDTLEESEVGECDSIGDHPSEIAPRRVHPRNSKTSACRGREAIDIMGGTTDKLHPNTSSLVSKGADLGTDAGKLDLDANSDDCRICGMDGTLLCCDGCPSAYHSRCIGVSKMFIPEGAWYCPECAVNRMGPNITKGTSLKGAEIFGVDPYSRVFLGTCDHLLVLSTSHTAELCFRYYRQPDIPSVLHTIYSSTQHINLYSEIFTAVVQYWNIPENLLSLPEIVEYKVNVSDVKLDAVSPRTVQPPLPEALGSITQTTLPALPLNVDTGKLSEQVKIETSMHAFPDSHVENYSRDQRNISGRPGGTDLIACTLLSANGNNTRHFNGMHLPKTISSESIQVTHDGAKGDKAFSYELVYMGSNFRPNAYTNQYIHGEFAASAAANLAVVSSEENKISEAQIADNPRKALSANILLQLKAFSSAATRFFWPNPEKKLVEVPRERCGWCLACRSPTSSKKACMLNAVCLNAMRSAMKILSGLRPNKNGEGSLQSIATYMLYMEESLRGLIAGPFLSSSYRRHWHKQVEQALTCRMLRCLLFELEENIRIVALSADWAKLVDNWAIESSMVQAATSVTSQKRGRRRRRPSAIPEADDDGSDGANDFTWWRGGKWSKLIFQKGILPRSILKRAARQGGAKKITGIHYAEDTEIPRRSRQFAWRAAVEMSNTVSQLALQVRFLDLHIRWSDLNRSEQSHHDGKGAETEASAFRNAIICDKKVVDNKIMYGLTFGNQKHLPSRVMKSIIEVEDSQDGKDKNWFHELRIPLYLIKEYEASAEDVCLPSRGRVSNVLSALQKRQLKASRRDIFSYLACKRDSLDKCSCASCQLDVRLRDAAKCSECQGFCHHSCTVSSTVHANEEGEFLATCKLCYNIKLHKENNSPTSPLPLGGQECQNGVNATKFVKAKSPDQPLILTIKNSSQTKASRDSSTAKKNRSNMSWGLIWKKKEPDDTGVDFRGRNIILKGNPCLEKPICHLCNRPYNSGLTYIRCETCEHWYHGDAVELDVHKIPRLKGFKCCRCRRIRSPVCPYADVDTQKAESKKLRLRSSRKEQSGADYSSGTLEQYGGNDPSTPVLSMQEDVLTQNNDPLLFSRVEQIAEPPDSGMAVEWNPASGTGAKKLPVRRHVKREGNSDDLSGNTQFQFDSSHVETNDPLHPTEGTYAPNNSWDVSNFADGLMFDYEDFNYEDMEFEPQTYFSFTELLSSENGEMDAIDADVGVLEHNGTNNDDQRELAFSSQKDVISVHCQMCSCSEPTPDLLCQSCGLWSHSHCSPWNEPSSDGGWKCSNCSEWR